MLKSEVNNDKVLNRMKIIHKIVFNMKIIIIFAYDKQQSIMNNFRTEVFHRAYRLTLTGKSFSQALKHSWAIYRLQKEMRGSVVEFRFRKISGDLRQAYGTLVASVIDPLIKGTEKKNNPTLITYYDLQKQAFRCFKEENLILS